MIGASVSLLLPVLAIWIWLSGTRGATLRLVLAFGAGIGVSSMTTLWLVQAGLVIGRPFVAVDAVVWIALAAAGAWYRWRRRPPAHDTSGPVPPPAIHWPILIVFLVVAGLAAGTALQEYLTSPHGEWDAWAVWNHKARFLVRGGERWTDQLSITWSNPTHPLLVPLAVARLWAYAQSEATAIPATLAALFGFGCAAVVMGSLGLKQPRALIAGAVILAPSLFLQQTMTQQADIPLTFFIVAALAALTMTLDVGAAFRRPRDGGVYMLLSGALAGAAAWTKNEGFLFAGAMAPAVLWLAIRDRAPQKLLWWGIGAAPMIATLLWFKRSIAPQVAATYFEEGQTVSSALASLTGSDRHALLLPAIWKEALIWGGPYAAGAAVAVVVMALVASIRSAPARLILGVLALMAIGDYAVFLLTPLDPVWLVQTTFYRLFTQLWPSLVLAACATGAGRRFVERAIVKTPV
jgi:hypothetical protein